MNGPDISPLLADFAGEDYRKALKVRLLQLADEADDEAYASRLREVASGDRPLRTLAFDPAWNKQVQAQIQSLAELPNLEEAQLGEIRARVEDLRDQGFGMSIAPDAVKSYAREALARAGRTHDIVRQDELTGWKAVRERAVEDNPGAGGGHDS